MYICIHHFLLSFTFHKNGTSGNKASEGTVCVCVCAKNTFNTGMFESLKQDPLLCNLPLGSVRPLPSVFIFNIPWKMRMMKIEASRYFETCSLKRASVKLKESQEFNEDALKKVFYRKLLHCYSLIKINFLYPPNLAYFQLFCKDKVQIRSDCRHLNPHLTKRFLNLLLN